MENFLEEVATSCKKEYVFLKKIRMMWWKEDAEEEDGRYNMGPTRVIKYKST